MQFSIGQSELSNAVALAGQSVSSRSTLPVLSNVLVTADEHAGTLTIAATNLETALSVVVAADVTDSGSVTLPARLLAATLAGIPPEARLTVELRVRDMAALLTYASHGKRRGQATIKGIDASEFPVLPALDGPAALTFTGAELGALIRQSAFAAADSKDTSRPALTGVLVTVNGALTAAATDGYRLAVATRPAEQDLPSLIIPARSLALADKLAGLSETVELRVAGNQLGLDFAGGKSWQAARLVSQTIDAKFPDYNAIVPKTAGTTVTVDTAELTRALKMAALFAHDASDRVLVTVKPGLFEDGATLNIAATSQEAGNFDTDLECEVTGGALTAAFNVAYLLQGLAALGEATAQLEFTRADRPGVLKGHGFTYVVMPMALEGGKK